MDTNRTKLWVDPSTGLHVQQPYWLDKMRCSNGCNGIVNKECIGSLLKMKTPHIINCVRCLFAAMLGAVLYAYSMAGDKYDAEALLFVCAAGLISIAGIAATWMRSVARLFVAVLTIILPLGMWLLLDLVVLRGKWWELLLVLSVQMLIPLAAGITILRDPKVRMFFEQD